LKNHLALLTETKIFIDVEKSVEEVKLIAEIAE